METLGATLQDNRKAIYGGIAAVALLGAAYLAFTTFNNDGSWWNSSDRYAAADGSGEDEGSIFDRASNALNSFIGRSPGERNDAALVAGKGKGKGRRAPREGLTRQPRERALGKVFDTPAAQDRVIPADDTPVDDILLPPEAFLSQAPAAAPVGTTPLAAGPISGPPITGGGGGGFFPGIGGGGGGDGGNPGGPGGNPPPTGGGGGGTPPPVPAVPEPATWAMLLLGMGATGAMMRRRPRIAAISGNALRETIG